jgi:hypothetical protein
VQHDTTHACIASESKKGFGALDASELWGIWRHFKTFRVDASLRDMDSV